jgi:hypothetical protein
MATEPQAFLDEVNAAYARLRADARAWEEELAERQLWDHAIGDGLETDGTEIRCCSMKRRKQRLY